jgi:hypothetical protein
MKMFYTGPKGRKVVLQLIHQQFTPSSDACPLRQTGVLGTASRANQTTSSA